MIGSFIVTIDTEGDNIWSSPREITTRNAEFLPRFQGLCERYGIKPTFLVNYEMAICPRFIEFGQDILRRGVAEIGMHLHAWNSPPLWPLTSSDWQVKPYLIEFPVPIVREKINFMTKLLQDTFNILPEAHRAGRWAMNNMYAAELIEAGYRVDCSVTPHINWGRHRGFNIPGTNYRGFPEQPYFIKVSNISRPGFSPLLEVPVTIRSCPVNLERMLGRMPGDNIIVDGMLRRIWPVRWLRPTGSNLNNMIAIIDQGLRRHELCMEFMLHSSELMPEGSPLFPTSDAIEKLYFEMEALFEHASTRFHGETLSEFRSKFMIDANTGATSHYSLTLSRTVNLKANPDKRGS